MKHIYVIGLMSGTSMDGINACLVKTNGEILNRTVHQIISSYDKETITLLKKLVFNYQKLKNDKNFLKYLSNLIASDNNIAVKKIVNLSGLKPELIGFHGQTVFHDPSKKISVQIGNGDLLAQLTKTNVVSQFRLNDIKNGGEGAPISPIYHKLLIESLNLDLPTCFLNIGGVSNLSYWDGFDLIGFDVGPGNGIMDVFCQETLGIPFDNFGEIASVGNPSPKIVDDFLNLAFFKKKYPKSIDRLEFNSFTKNLILKGLNNSDVLATFVEFTVLSIIEGIKLLPNLPKNLIIIGGGKHNKYLIKRIRQSISCKIIEANQFSLPSDFIEAEMIAYLAARKVNNLPITFPSTTGVSFPCTGGLVSLN